MPGDVPDVAPSYEGLTFDSDAIGPSSDPDGELLTSSGSTYLDLTSGAGGGAMSAGGGLDISGIVKQAGDAAVNLTKTIGGLAQPPVPRIPTPPATPQLPASLPQTPAAPPQPAPPPAPLSADPQPGPPASQSGASPPAPRLSRGSKIAIGVGIGGIVLGTALVVTAKSKKRR